jgi:hypothetical protein
MIIFIFISGGLNEVIKLEDKWQFVNMRVKINEIRKWKVKKRGN